MHACVSYRMGQDRTGGGGGEATRAVDAASRGKQCTNGWARVGGGWEGLFGTSMR